MTDKIELEKYIDFHRDLRTRYLNLFDIRAIALIAALSTGLGLFLTKGYILSDPPQLPGLAMVQAVTLSKIHRAGGAIGALLVIVAIAGAGITLCPRPLFFPSRGILKFDLLFDSRTFSRADEYVRTITAMSDEDIRSHRLAVCFELGAILHSKAAYISWSFWLGGVGLLIVFADLLFFGARG